MIERLRTTTDWIIDSAIEKHPRRSTAAAVLFGGAIALSAGLFVKEAIVDPVLGDMKARTEMFLPDDTTASEAYESGVGVVIDHLVGGSGFDGNPEMELSSYSRAYMAAIEADSNRDTVVDGATLSPVEPSADLADFWGTLGQ